MPEEHSNPSGRTPDAEEVRRLVGALSLDKQAWLKCQMEKAVSGEISIFSLPGAPETSTALLDGLVARFYGHEPQGPTGGPAPARSLSATLGDAEDKLGEVRDFLLAARMAAQAIEIREQRNALWHLANVTLSALDEAFALIEAAGKEAA